MQDFRLLHYYSEKTGPRKRYCNRNCPNVPLVGFMKVEIDVRL